MCNTSRAAAWCAPCQEWAHDVITYDDHKQDKRGHRVEAVVRCQRCGKTYRVEVTQQPETVPTR